ncbi:YdbH domain-containing protein [Pseudoalteromonas sp. MM17-2]|uniref:YdbH domain-containing protein n=1 Tax=Pseudoalteromonas sp. MM17-2 TaxID=2917753 RepID=UPI001EF469F2|nr:YdbH domain-containing protein [Pseudoalteromonas sp. MM17-2]MCG7544258.1 YdbH domain-containing protein [Pseudoalteromonas sp. MM17-2]
MLRKLLIGLAVIGLTLATTYLFRIELTFMVAKHYLDADKAELTCADWQWGSELTTITVNKLCVGYRQHRLVIEQARITPQHIDIEKAALTLTKQQTQSSSDTGKPQALNLPLTDSRPLVTVESFFVYTPYAAAPVRMTVSETQLNQWVLNGDIAGDIAITSQHIDYELHANQALRAQLMAVAEPSLMRFNISQWALPELQVQGRYYGNRIDNQITIASQATWQHTPCPVQVSSQGRIEVRSKNMRRFSLDTSALTTHLRAQAQCDYQASLKPYFPELLKGSWQLTLAEPRVSIDESEVQLTQVLLTHNSEQNKVGVRLEAPRANWRTAQVAADYALQLETQSLGRLSVSGQATEQRISGAFKGQVAAPVGENVHVAPVSATGEFDHNFAGATALHGQLKIAQLTMAPYSGQQVAVTVDATISADNSISARLDTFAAVAANADIKLLDVEQNYQVQADLGAGRRSAQVEVQSSIGQLNSAQLRLSELSVDSRVDIARSIDGEHLISWQQAQALVKHSWQETAFPITVVLPPTPLPSLQAIASQLAPELSLTAGTLSAQLHGDARLQRMQWQLDVDSASVLYQSYLAENINTSAQGQWNSGQLQLDDTSFTISQLRAGPVLSQVQGLWGYDQDAYLKEVQAGVLGGTLSLDKLYVTGLTKRRAPTLVEIAQINAQSLLALEPQQGIEVTGVLAATLPIRLEEQGVSVENGRIYSQAPGKLTIKDNAAFDAVKAQQAELGPMLGMLENLDINSINADVDLNTDGWLTMAMQLKGENPEHQQAVNFNYNHQENIYTLFKALRLSDEITKKVEQEYQAKE